MSLLLKDRVWSMEAPTAKRGVYPLHGYKIGLYRLPIKLEDLDEIKSIHDGLKKTFEMDMYADRIYATYRWQEQNMKDPDAKGYREVELSVTVEIVTGEVVDIIYQIFPIEKFGDPNWVQDYRKKADHFAKMVIDTILRNTILADKMVSYYVKKEKISEVTAIQKLEELTPLAKIVLGAKQKAIEVAEEDEGEIEIPDGAKPGPIDVEYKSKMKQSSVYDAAGYSIKTWGRKGTNNGIMGVWGEFVSVDYDICIADGGCIEACPVGVYEWFDTPGNPGSDQKPLMSKEPDCIFCLACEGVCPPQAIKIFEAK
ncbi:MAG: ferredoxin family protein [Nitrosopumilus sp.]|nr:ferredoxin family protein [Nitrosopumilus sp.]